MEPVATDDVFGAGLGASPLAVRNPGPEKVMKPLKPRMISLCRGFFISPMATGVGFGRRPLKETERPLWVQSTTLWTGGDWSALCQ